MKPFLLSFWWKPISKLSKRKLAISLEKFEDTRELFFILPILGWHGVHWGINVLLSYLDFGPKKLQMGTGELEHVGAKVRDHD